MLSCVAFWTRRNALVLVDEAYVEFAPEGTSVVGLVASSRASWCCARSPRPLVSQACARATSWRAPAVVDVLGAVRQIYSVDVLAQAAALAAVTHRDALAPVVADVVAERERLSAGLSALPGVRTWPSAGNFVLVRVAGAHRVWERLRDEHSVLVRDFSSAPGLEGCLRISVGTREENDVLLDALATLLREEA